MTPVLLRCARSVAVAVMSLVASPAMADSLNLMWDPNAESVSGYAVYVGITSGSYAQRFDVGGATTFTYTSATAGQRYCFAVAAYSPMGESPKSTEVCGYSNQAPTLASPGNQSSVVGQSVSLQLNGSDPDGQPISYSATGLPSGLSLMPSTGYIAGAGSTAGTFSVIAMVSDGALSSTRTFNWTMTAPASLPDTTAPLVSIVAPTTSPSYATATAAISLSGNGSDNVGVTQVSWTNDRGGSGMASGTSNWSVGSVGLQGGTNLITVTARDAAGNVGKDVLTVNYSAPAPAPAPSTPAPSVVLTAQLASLMKFKKSVGLSWTSAPWSSVMVYRNGTRIARTSNDGLYTDSLRSAGTYTYQVCSASSTTACSNTVTIYN